MSVTVGDLSIRKIFTVSSEKSKSLKDFFLKCLADFLTTVMPSCMG